MSSNARDLTQRERNDIFGTAEPEVLKAICCDSSINHTMRANGLGIVIWRSDLPERLESILVDNELHGAVYVHGWSAAA
jgi:hypothetical protein